MLLRTKGKTLNVNSQLVGRVTRIKGIESENTFYIHEDPQIDVSTVSKNSIGILTNQPELLTDCPQVYSVSNFDHLEEGDIVSLGPEGNINTLYRVNSNQNTLLATERCNSNCLMCSQPPRDRDDISYLFDIHSKLIPLIPKDCVELGISGGEPTLMGDYFFELLELIGKELPNTEIHLLTNGRTFAWYEIAERLGSLGLKQLMLGIPIYSDYYQMHDYIVQAENAFYQTILGVQNLNRYGQRIEIRVVLHKQTVPRLKKLAEYLYRNMPYVEHITFMGLEYIGYTPHNINELWIDPYDYQEELAEAVEYLEKKGMLVSIYNTPLCLLPERVWGHARKSISDWKNEFMDECKSCSKIDECGGFFKWNLKKPSEHIKAILN
jgi:His-Xaa-Ser system radical SAM maturase HxsC